MKSFREYLMEWDKPYTPDHTAEPHEKAAEEHRNKGNMADYHMHKATAHKLRAIHLYHQGRGALDPEHDHHSAMEKHHTKQWLDRIKGKPTR